MGKKHKYGVVIDAGSSGSRVYVYEYKRADYVKNDDDQEELVRLPKVKTKDSWHVKIHPGISTFGDRPERVGEEHLEGLVDFAIDIVPKDDAADTPIFLLATAGMRLLPEHQRQAVLEQTCAYLQQNSPFLISDCDLHVQVIPGETEGLYGWMAANYLLGGFDEPINHNHGKGHHTYGFLDMGGASAQIAFAPNATEAEKHANDLKLLRLRKVNGESVEYGVFVTTWLGFGANEARRRYVEHLLNAFEDVHEIADPCLPVGLRVSPAGVEVVENPYENNGNEPVLVGTGRFSQCLEKTYPLLEKTRPCDDEPCLLNGVHTPAIDFDVNHFVGVSEYWHTTHEIFAMAHKDKAYDFHTYQKQVTELCERDWASIEADVAKETWGHKVDEQTVEEVCFKASWLINMLHDGIGVPRVGMEAIKQPGSGHENGTNAVLDHAEDRGFLDPFQAVDEIDGTEVSWTLGKMLLYASSQMPPADGAMAVGFGSNIPGKVLPPDFELAIGSIAAPTQNDDDASGDWYDNLSNSSYSRRIPGILIVLLIIALAVYLVCGRERRLSLWNKLTGNHKSSPSRPFKRRKGGATGILGSKFFSTSTEPAYERVLEEGTDLPNFELTDIDDDVYSDTGSFTEIPRTGRTSGWATPARGLSPDIVRNSPKTKGNKDSVSSSSSSGSANAFVNPLERGGLIGRVDSRERLSTFVQGGGSSMVRSGSHAGSPRRSPLHGPLSPFIKANVD